MNITTSPLRSSIHVFIDMEFTGLVQDAQPISLGCYSPSGHSFYAEYSTFKPELATQWIRDNVVPHLQFNSTQTPSNTFLWDNDNITCYGTKEYIRHYFMLWLHNLIMKAPVNQQDVPVTIVADTLAYDWVLFCDLFGGALELPKNISYIPIDISTLLYANNLDPDTTRLQIVKDLVRAINDCTTSRTYCGTVQLILDELIDDMSAPHHQHNALFDAKVACVLWRWLTRQNS